MPRIRRSNVPRTILDHLLERIQEREISPSQLRLMADWIDTDPEVPDGRWFKSFPEMHVCGEGELVKTILRHGQVPDGIEVD